MLPAFFASMDLLKIGILGSNDIRAMAESAQSHASDAVLQGGVGTSLEEPESRVRYRLLDGDDVAMHIPLLDDLYRGPFLSLASRTSGRVLMPSPERRSGVNVNVLDGGRRYEWHVDSNPLTALLVLTDSDGIRGGRLLFGQEPELQVALPLKAGHLLVFDARNAPHAVEPLKGMWTRITAPMNYFVAGEPVVRPDGLDKALYGSETAS